MSRPKKDPNIRKTEFISAAQALFFARGYNATSIQDILQAVGKNAVSPSVFYYYFKSKEDIYHAVMESYIEGYMQKLEGSLQNERLSLEERFGRILSIFMETLLESSSVVDISNGISNRMFVLDIRERITQRVIPMWEELIRELPWRNTSGMQDRKLAIYITGGICELIYDYVFQQSAEQQNIKILADEIVNYSASLLGAPQMVRQQLIKLIEKVV
jgi:AcrR family transcriptional regulator